MSSLRGRCRSSALIVAALVIPAGGIAAPSLYELVDTRLELMDEVAAHKWRHGLPVEDRARESVVLESAVQEGLRFGVRPSSSRALFAAQIEAAKSIQRYWFAQWKGTDGPESAPDLTATVRPELLRLGRDILAAAGGGDGASGEAFAEAVDVVGLDGDSRLALLEALRGIERYPHRLAQILDTGTVRIGTTGDYPPFSHADAAGASPGGIDVELGRLLAQALGVEAVFVATSWPTLMDDLAAGRFDVGMSGISRTVDRQRHGFLSRPYYVGGKAAIARCDRAARYPDLEAIDRAGVRVVVNPGGTNERFVDARIRRALVVLHPDNRTIFDLIVDGQADVMITDRVEVEFQAARREALCATLQGTLTYQEKAYLLPQDPVWLEFVDTWLALALADGTVTGVFRRHGVEPQLP